MDVSLSVRFTATERRERGAARRVLIDRGPAERALARRSMHGTLRHRSGALAARCRWNVIRSFIMKSGCRSCALAAASSSALGINRRKIIHTSTSIWAMPVRSAAPIALRYSVSTASCGRLCEFGCRAALLLIGSLTEAPNFDPFGDRMHAFDPYSAAISSV